MMILTGPKPMRKGNYLSPILIDFYVPSVAPLLDSTETLLQLSENTTLFRFVAYVQVSVKIIIYINTVEGGGRGYNFVAPLHVYPLA
jgi:hypothetical protein